QQLPLRQLLLAAERADVDLKRVLGELAYRVHGQGAQGKRQVAYIDEATLYKTVAQLNGNDWGWGQQLVGVMKLRAGLLVEDRPGLFAFPHRTFQEYLAGTHLADQPDFARQGARLAAEGVIWREVILLAVWHLVYQRRDVSKPLLLVGELCPAMAVEMATGWLQVWLAGEVLLEMGLRRVQDEGLGRELLARVQQRLA
ncbi:MAG: hypothetical protein KDE56_33505, partial [Anaerolineales bacterium]|nr:hypothetical protein [Anaerolineales bacterium]